MIDPLFFVAPLSMLSTRSDKSGWIQYKYLAENSECVHLVNIDPPEVFRRARILLRRRGVYPEVLERFLSRRADQTLISRGYGPTLASMRVVMFFHSCASRRFGRLPPGHGPDRIVRICHTEDTKPGETWCPGPRMVSGHPPDVRLDFLCYAYRTDHVLEMARVFGPSRSIHLPHCVDHSRFRDWGMDKDIDILFYGAVSQEYPLRRRIHDVLRAMIHTDRHLKIRIVDRSNPVVLDDLSRLINRSWLTVATPTSYDWFVRKFIEIPMSGSVVAGYIPASERQLFAEHYVGIDEAMSDTEIRERLLAALADKGSLRGMASAMVSRVTGPDGYTLEACAKRFQGIRERIAEVVEAG